jgi:hypothetical protein
VGLFYILVLCMAGTCCLAPLSIYLLILAQVTRRDHPSVVSGPWDFVGLVVGLSGFFLFGGGLVLTVFQENFRYWMRGNFEPFRAAWNQEKMTWVLLATAYFILVVGGICLTLLSRRRTLVVYNVLPNSFESLLGDVFEQLNAPVERRGNVWYSGGPLVELERFSGGRTVTVRWLSANTALFQEFERQVREGARSIYTDDNPATHWIMAAAVGTGVAAACGLGLLIFAVTR